MLRFLPDGVLEGLLRPFVMADPLAGIYFEDGAPDWRFAALIVFGLAALAGRRRTAPFSFAQQLALVGLALCFVVWTVVIGNGRYFITGLLWIGPAVVLMSRRLPGTNALRWSLLSTLTGIQLTVALDAHLPNRWGMVRWASEPALAMAPSPLRERPAVFLMMSKLSYSMLVPAFDTQSRWVNLIGQTDIVPRMPEHARLHAALRSGLPVYAVGPALRSHIQPGGRLSQAMFAFVTTGLAAHGHALVDEACTVIAMPLLHGPGNPIADTPRAVGGFWFCRAVPIDAPAAMPLPDAASAAIDKHSVRADAAFDAVERRCPRFFPPGNGLRHSYQGVITRMYSSSDTWLHVDGTDQVLFHHFRAVNPTLVGSVDDVVAGRFTVPCAKLPGRYQLPWQRD